MVRFNTRGNRSLDVVLVPEEVKARFKVEKVESKDSDHAPIKISYSPIQKRKIQTNPKKFTNWEKTKKKLNINLSNWNTQAKWSEHNL
jgi:exonuclease III